MARTIARQAVQQQMGVRIGMNIRAARLAEGMTQRRLGELMGTPKCLGINVNQLEHGLRLPDLVTLYSIADALGIEIMELVRVD